MTNSKSTRLNRQKSRPDSKGPGTKGNAFKGKGVNRPYKGKPSGKSTQQEAKPAVETIELSDKKERIAKVIARAGLCSRRDAERWIAEGRVKLDGKVLETPAIVVGPDNAIEVNGEPLPLPERPRLWKYHKPKGQITAARDPEGRDTVFDHLPKDLPRLQPVGRLDYNSEGLLLFTNDGGLKRKMELPATGWTRRYRVRVHGQVDERHIKTLAEGITIDGVHYAPIEASISHQAKTNAWMLMSLKEGKNREIRRVCEHLGLIVNRLIRVSYGPFQLGEIEPGDIVELPAKLIQDQFGLEGKVSAPKDKTSKQGPSGKKPQGRAGRKPADKASTKPTGKKTGPSRGKPASGSRGKRS
ncbi:pseudouridine synthase [Kiloniella majae]|uniref:pseudouridine synthase n=1 Tax=Kiloniella majae TaxID=1938558 RepID=UPI000A2786C7|nr:pseudouridine synthase [Kiloniella majae]